ncbi:hypothetical protein LCGC14_2912680, partial [marine sediment metagenome]
NLDCYFCITQSYMKGVKHEKLSLEYMKRLVDFLSDWGVRGLCISGGGEPTLHRGLPELIDYAKDKMDVAVVTNGTKYIEEFKYCRWVALSVDASNREAYKKIKGRELFDQVMVNIKKMVRANGADYCFKFLILPENQYEIYDACKLAKELGVQDFHARPVDFERGDIENSRPLDMDVESIHRQFEMCHSLETDEFRVHTITHKFDSEFHVKYDYEKCLAAPLLLPVLTDGNSYLCVEHKMEEKYRLGSCEDILSWWGSDKHRQMIKDVVPKEDCSRCIYSSYHQQIEAIKNDRMCLSFP